MRLYDQNIWGNMKPDQCIANRNGLIRGLIAKYDPDVCGFQECNPKTSRAGDTPIVALLEDAYEEVCPTLADRNFTPIFYHRERMRLLDGGWFLFDGKNDKNSKSVTWALLEERAGKQRCAVLSVHFWWKWESEEDTLQRRANAAQLVDFCRALRQEHGVPIFVMGDLNSGIGSHQGEDAYREMLRLGMQDARNLAKESTQMLTAHAYPILNAEGKYVDGGDPIKTLDYIFCYGELPTSVDSFRVLTEREALDSSDHCPLLLDVQL
ncbi:MAG: endonuclease/exonuclease/phosphatase family protein [Clostridia bacterium]|nr:endonuclease/exonuclease/phosphatase family protein [Clostridia bacterium]